MQKFLLTDGLTYFGSPHYPSTQQACDCPRQKMLSVPPMSVPTVAWSKTGRYPTYYGGHYAATG